MDLFEFATATRIIFGNGTISQVSSIAASFGNKVLIVIGKSQQRAQFLLSLLEQQKLKYTLFSVGEEPTTEIASEGLKIARETGCDLVIGFGGGSVIDTGKAIAALMTNGGEFIDYMEVIGKGMTLTKPSAPFIAIPTTAGTGAEVTKNSVLCSEEHKQKVSLRSTYMLPQVAIVDPQLTISLPKEVTASTGLDAFTQCLESFSSNKANPLTDAVAKEGLLRGARSLRRVYHEGNDINARGDMAICSLFGGLALANSKLGGVHGFAGVIGGMFPGARHGAVCAALLPHVIRVNVTALQQRNPQSPYLKKYDEIAQIITGNRDATSKDAVQWIQELCCELTVPPLSSYGITNDLVATIVTKSASSSSMQGNPIKLTERELTEIMESAL